MTACAKCGGDASSVSGKKKRCPHCNALKHECAPEEWSKILATNFKKLAKKVGMNTVAYETQVDDAIQAGWCATLKAASSETFNRSHEKASAYLISSVYMLYKSVIFSNHKWPFDEWDWKRNSTVYEFSKAKAKGLNPYDNPRIANGGARSARTNISLNKPVGLESKTELGELCFDDSAAERQRYREAVAAVHLIDKKAKLVLDNRDYKVFKMRYFENYTYKEIAESLGLTRQRAQQLVTGDKHNVSLTEKLGFPPPAKMMPRGRPGMTQAERNAKKRIARKA